MQNFYFDSVAFFLYIIAVFFLFRLFVENVAGPDYKSIYALMTNQNHVFSHIRDDHIVSVSEY